MGTWPHFEEDEIKAVEQVLRSGKVNQWTGSEVKSFEKEFAQYLGVDHAIAVANGTLALELCLKALDIGPGDEVIVTPRTFLASASCVVSLGATPIFADIDYDSGCINTETIAAVVTDKTKAVIPVHLAGWPSDMDAIMALAAEHNFYVIEDCAQAHGGEYKGKKLGAWGHMSAFSFCQDKIMTTGGEGGMIFTNDEALWKKAWAYKDHGKSYDTVFNTEHPHGFRWLHESFGTNWRMTEMQAAIGRCQLRKLDAWNSTRTELANIYIDAFKDIPWIKIAEPADGKHAYYRFYISVIPENMPEGLNRDSVIDAIEKTGQRGFTGSCSEIYLERCFQEAGLVPKERLPMAKALGENSVMFLLHPTLEKPDIDGLISAVLNLAS